MRWSEVKDVNRLMQLQHPGLRRTTVIPITLCRLEVPWWTFWIWCITIVNIVHRDLLVVMIRLSWLVLWPSTAYSVHTDIVFHGPVPHTYQMECFSPTHDGCTHHSVRAYFLAKSTDFRVGWDSIRNNVKMRRNSFPICTGCPRWEKYLAWQRATGRNRKLRTGRWSH